MSMASVTALDLTVQLPANDDTEVLEAGESTVNMEADDATAILLGDEVAATVEMSLEDDETAEMPIKRDSKSA